MPIDLVTGTPGAGKTLYTVSMMLKPMHDLIVQQSEPGYVLKPGEIKRRLCIGGIPDLLLQHELIDAPAFDPEVKPEPSDGQERLPGQPPLDGVVRSVLNWWQWAMPGDVIVVDECQTVFRPMASGRKAPLFVRKLETHRHYGVDFIFITQHPQLVHSNVRNLVGQHRHVRRLFGGTGRTIYTWDRCGSPDSTKGASSSPWWGRKSAYGLYKSSVLHTKQRFSIPLPLILLGVMFIVLPLAIYTAFDRMRGATTGERLAKPAAAASAPAVVRYGDTMHLPPPAPQAMAPADPGQGAGSAGELASTGAPATATVEAGVLGCVAMASRCECIGSDGKRAQVEPAACRESVSRGGGSLVGYPIGDDGASRFPAWTPAPQRAPQQVAAATPAIDHPAGAPRSPQLSQ